MNDALTIALIEIILKYGPVAALKLFSTLDDTDITPEKIRALKVSPPTDYLGGN